MRIIKFRAWDKKENKMYKVQKIHWLIGKDIENLEIMQYIGLKDKNRKEIYEGDILSWKNTDIKLNQVIWNEKGFWEAWEIGTDWHHDSISRLIENNDYGIIGNIYENKNLLEKL